MSSMPDSMLTWPLPFLEVLLPIPASGDIEVCRGQATRVTRGAGAEASEEALTQLRSALKKWCWSIKGKVGNLQEVGSIFDRVNSFEWNHGLGCSRWSEEGLLRSEGGRGQASEGPGRQVKRSAIIPKTAGSPCRV